MDINENNPLNFTTIHKVIAAEEKEKTVQP